MHRTSLWKNDAMHKIQSRALDEAFEVRHIRLVVIESDRRRGTEQRLVPST